MNQRISGFALVVAMLTSALPAHAQWVWVNERGIKQLSDQPPPISVPPNRILKAPPGQMPDLRKELNASPTDAAPAPTPEKPEPKVNARPTLAERNADYNKRRVDTAEKEQKATQEAQQAASKSENCKKTRTNLAALESGQRIVDIDAQGERSFIDDAQRAKRIKENQSLLAQNCQ
jgi:type IV secretory pathway VirB10-like protein